MQLQLRESRSMEPKSVDEDDIGLRHLRVLSLLLEVGSITRAAQILDTTQSSVSKILAKLRVHFGDPLFVRVGLSLRPTPRAIELAQPLRGLLTASDAMRSSTSSFDPDLPPGSSRCSSP